MLHESPNGPYEPYGPYESERQAHNDHMALTDHTIRERCIDRAEVEDPYFTLARDA